MLFLREEWRAVHLSYLSRQTVVQNDLQFRVGYGDQFSLFLEQTIGKFVSLMIQFCHVGTDSSHDFYHCCIENT